MPLKNKKRKEKYIYWLMRANILALFAGSTQCVKLAQSVFNTLQKTKKLETYHLELWEYWRFHTLNLTLHS